MIRKRVLDYVQKHHMLEKDDYVVAGVSGGADSVCLLFLLHELRKEIPIEIHVVHINHMIRVEADADAAYVKELCEKFNISFTLVERDVEALAKRQHISTEEAGRNTRYEAFHRILTLRQGNRNGKIAVAHNKNDCCETFLFHLFRGSSLKGLSGIQPVRNEVIRPLLCLERCEIEEFLDKNGIKYCIDSTNLEDNYTRNKIRHHILETAVEEINSAAVSHIYKACTKISEAYSFIDDLAESAYAACVSKMQKGNVCGLHIVQERFMEIHPTIQGYIIMKALADAAECRKDLESVHAAQVKALFGRQCGRKINLPYGICAERDYTGVFIYRIKSGTAEKSGVGEYKLSSGESERLLNGEHIEVRLGEGEVLVFSIKKVDFGENRKNIPQKKYTKWLDYDKIKNSIVIRTRREGDYLTIDMSSGELRKKTLKSYFIDNKVPKEQRNELALVTEESHVLWIVGGRISSFYKINDNTKRILELSLIKENKKQKG
ncbi:MAG: tRNA lysidine(34) synthetase TilS [Lachnospiraceae bacterium]|nr:tRNA lysidine(34) synthetase TilS [Lachnospiraceae bacterium]